MMSETRKCLWKKQAKETCLDDHRANALQLGGEHLGKRFPYCRSPLFYALQVNRGIEQNLLQLDRPRRVLPFQQWLSCLCAVIYTSSSSFEHIEWWSISHLILQGLQIRLSPDEIEKAIYILNACTPWQIVNLRPFYELAKNTVTTIFAISRFCFAVRPNQHLGQQFVKCK